MFPVPEYRYTRGHMFLIALPQTRTTRVWFICWVRAAETFTSQHYGLPDSLVFTLCSGDSLYRRCCRRRTTGPAYLWKIFRNKKQYKWHRQMVRHTIRPPTSRTSPLQSPCSYHILISRRCSGYCIRKCMSTTALEYTRCTDVRRLPFPECTTCLGLLFLTILILGSGMETPWNNRKGPIARSSLDSCKCL
jgi:hypothetical protein